MNPDNSSRWIAIVANLGVIAGIVFLAFELHQNNLLLGAEARRVVMENRANTLERWAINTELMQLRAKAVKQETLSQAEIWRIDTDFTALMVRWEYDVEQFHDGFLDYLPFPAWKAIFNRWPYMYTLWEKQKNRFSEEFVSEIDNMLEPSKRMASE